MGDPHPARIVERLVVLKEKWENPSEHAANMEHNFRFVESKISGLSEKESADCVINLAHERRSDVSLGLLFFFLTDKPNNPTYFKLLEVIASDQWFITLCNMNMIILEIYPKAQESCKDQLIYFFREAIKLNVPKIDNVFGNMIRALNGSGEWSNKLRAAQGVISIMNENEQWLMNVKPGSTVIINAMTTFSHLLVDITIAGGFEPLRQNIIKTLMFIIRNRFADCCILGRDFILILMRLAKISQFAAVWKDLINNKFGLGYSLDDIMFRTHPVQFVSGRLSYEMMRKLEFIITNIRPNLADKHIEWFTNTFLRGPDAGSLRAEIIRVLLHFGKKPPDVPLSNAENETRSHLIYYFLSNAQPGAEMQWLKTCMWIDWVTYDPQLALSAIEPVISVINLALAAQPLLANSLLEYGFKLVANLHPPKTELFRKAANLAMKQVADCYGLQLSSILENVRLEKSVREGVRDLWRDFVRSAAAPLVMQPSTSSAPAPQTPAPAAVEVKPIKVKVPTQKEKEEPVEEKKASPPPTATHITIVRDRTEDKAALEAELDTTMGKLRADIKPIIEGLRESFRSEESDESDRAEAVQKLLQKLLENDGSLEEDQQEYIAICLQILMGKVVESGKSILPEQMTEDLIQDSLAHPLFIIFRNLCFTPENDTTTRQPMVNMISTMRERDNTITYLLLYFMRAGINDANSDCVSCYQDIANCLDKQVDELLASDMQQCALDDINLFAYLIPFIFDKMSNDASSSPAVFAALCTNIDAKNVMDLVGEIVRENVSLFRRDSFGQIVQASCEWETTAQWAFWQLVHAEGIPVDWVSSLIPKLKPAKNSEAATNVLLMLKRIDREPTLGLMRSILTRVPSPDDSFTVNALKILIEDADMCTRVAEHIGGLIKKQIQSGDISTNATMGKSQGKKSPQKLSMEQVLQHIQQFTNLCLTKEKKVAESLLSKTHVQEAFNAAKTCEKASFLRSRFTELYTVVEILNDDSPQSSRTLRGNRGGSSSKSSKRVAQEDKDDEQPSKKKRKAVIMLDSDSD